MDNDLMDRLQSGLNEKRTTLETWLTETPAEKRQVVLGNASDEAVASHLSTLQTAVEAAEEGTLGACRSATAPSMTTCWKCITPAAFGLEHLSSDQARSLEFEIELAQTVQPGQRTPGPAGTSG